MELIAGRSYTGTTTGTIKGERVFQFVDFVAARTMEPEQFIRSSASPDQDRVFVVNRTGVRDVSSPGVQAVPALFLTGSIRESEYPRREHAVDVTYAIGDSGEPMRVYRFGSWMRARNGKIAGYVGGQSLSMTAMLQRLIRKVETERKALR